MVEIHQNGADTGYWGYLIRPDKSAAPHLEQLCLSLARIICKIEPGCPTDRLTPRKLAAFYRSVGGNLDTLFLRTTESGLSFLYRTIGCFHSLESTGNPFKTPVLPCLTPEGFVKWQTVQLLLCPEEHVRYLQQAVRVYDVKRPDGSLFPKSIPRASFPDRPDTEMEEWHKQVTSQLNQESYMNRLRNSPYHSPHPTERQDGYFSQPIPRVRRPSKPSRTDSRGEDGSPSFNSRRSSEPEFLQGPNPVDHARKQYANPRDPRVRSVSANRPNMAARQRSATTGHAARPVTSHPSSRTSNERPPVSFFRGQYPPDQRGRGLDRPSASGSSAGEESADDASSEDSRGQRRSKRSRVTSSFLSVLPFTSSSRQSSRQKRSQSHDATAYRKERPPPRRDDRDNLPPMRSSAETFQQRPAFVRFKQDIFDNPAAASAPESAPHGRRPHSSDHRSDPRYARNPGLTDPVSPVNYNLTRETSGSSSSENRQAWDMPTRQLRKAGASIRPSSQTGVQGRKYASVDQQSPGPPGAGQQDQKLRYSLAV